MLIASLLIFGASQLIGGHMPHGRTEPADLLPGLIFLSPPFSEMILGYFVQMIGLVSARETFQLLHVAAHY